MKPTVSNHRTWRPHASPCPLPVADVTDGSWHSPPRLKHGLTILHSTLQAPVSNGLELACYGEPGCPRERQYDLGGMREVGLAADEGEGRVRNDSQLPTWTAAGTICEPWKEQGRMAPVGKAEGSHLKSRSVRCPCISRNVLMGPGAQGGLG